MLLFYITVIKWKELNIVMKMCDACLPCNEIKVNHAVKLNTRLLCDHCNEK